MKKRDETKEEKTRNDIREMLRDSDWKFRGYIAKYFGYTIILFGVILGIYRFIIVRSFIEYILITALSLLLGGFGILISWMILPESTDKMKKN
jgi:hypothetical protein